jgi:hypothetical protein
MSSIRRWTFVFITFHTFSPCHESRRTNQWKTENDIPTLEWSPQSPDLNIIENVWKFIKTKFQRRIDDIRNAEDLKTVVAKIWTSLQLHYIRSLYDSLPMRLRRHKSYQWNVQSCDIIEFPKWPTSFQRLCSKQRKNIVFHTEINNKTYLKLLVFCDIASSS